MARFRRQVPVVLLLACGLLPGPDGNRVHSEQPSHQTPAQPAPIERGAISPGDSVTCALEPDQQHAYELTLTAGGAVDLAVEQQGIDVIVSVSGPDGRPIDEVDDLAEQQTPERLHLVAEASGPYRLIVRSEPLPGVQPGRYRIDVGPVRMVTAEDRTRVRERRRHAEQLATASARLMEIAKGRTPGPGEIQQLESELDAVIVFSESRRHARQLASAWRFKSLLLLFSNRDHEALEVNEQRLALLVGARWRGERAHALNHMADALTRTGETRRAYEAYQAALALPLSPQLEAITYDNLGFILRRMGRFQESLDAHQKALSYFRKAGPSRSEAVVLSRMANVWNEIGDPTRALVVQQEALDIYKAIDDRISEVRALNLRAARLIENDDVEAARTVVERARMVGDIDKVPINMADTNATLAQIHEALADHPRTLELAGLALQQYRALSFGDGETRALLLLAAAHLASGRPVDADSYARQAAALAQASGTWIQEAEAHYILARAARMSGIMVAAREHLESAIEGIERARATLGGSQLRTSFTARFQDVYEEQVDVLMALHQTRPAQGLDRAALEASELSRARSLLDVLAASASDIRGQVDGALLDRERDVRLRLNDKDVLARAARANARMSDASQLDREVASLAAEVQVIESDIAARSPAFAALTRPRALSVDRIQRDVLDADTVLLEYAVGKERTWLWGVTSTEIVAFELPGRAALEPAVREALELLTTRQRREPRLAAAESRQRLTAADARLETSLATLGHSLLGPVARRLRGDWRGKRLVVVASGPLEYVPFAALRLPGSTAPPHSAPPDRLIDDHEVVSAPSASVTAALRREPDRRRVDPAASALQTGRTSLAIVADPVFEASDPRVLRARRSGSSHHTAASSAVDVPSVARAQAERVLAGMRGGTLARLPFSRAEADALVALVPRGEATVSMDFAANREWAISAPLGAHRILHFATHGLIDTRHPQLSSIVLSLVDEQGRPRDGFLRMHDIYNRSLPVDLVVLSACQTALGREVRGEGLVGLTRGFMYAGARRVVASLWQVDDLATAELMTRFYRHMLQGGERPAAALRAAQLELARDPRWNAPFFWAGFVLQGEWR